MNARELNLAPQVAMRLLEELIYERVRAHVDVLELTWFESDLDEALQRVLEDLDEDGRDDAPARVLAAGLIDRAWNRVEAEWREARDGDDCALCELDRRVRDELRREAHR